MSSLKAQDIQSSVNHLIDGVQKEFQKTTPKSYGITFAIALFLCIFRQYLFRSKEEGVITFTVILTAVVLTAIAVAVRVKTAENQYPWTVVILTFFAMFLQLAPSSILIFGFAPLIINAIRSELKSD